MCRASLLLQAMVFKDRVKGSSFCMFIDCTDGGDLIVLRLVVRCGFS